MTDSMISLIGIIASSLVTLLICILNNNAQAKRSQLSNEVAMAEIRMEISSLKELQAKHNSVVERVYHLEEVEKVNIEKFKIMDIKIEDLQKHRKE